VDPALEAHGIRITIARGAIDRSEACVPSAGSDVHVTLLGSGPDALSALSAGLASARLIREEGGLRLFAHQSEHGTYHRLRLSDDRGHGEFLIAPRGEALWAAWSSEVHERGVLAMGLGPVLGWALRMRDVLCLHAGVVAVGDRAIALVGPRGAGKSTLVAALTARGYPVLADDFATVAPVPGGFLVHPGVPEVRLSPSTAGAVTGGRDGAKLWAGDKYRLPLSRGEGRFRFHRLPLPLGGVYLLGPRTRRREPQVTPCPSGRALAALALNRYPPLLPVDRARERRELGVLAGLVGATPVRSVDPPNDLARLEALCDGVLEDASALGVADG
jgi:hypothetical protein